jgi:hypothetical protein
MAEASPMDGFTALPPSTEQQAGAEALFLIELIEAPARICYLIAAGIAVNTSL